MQKQKREGDLLPMERLFAAFIFVCFIYLNQL